jgi:hypothetical protein
MSEFRIQSHTSKSLISSVVLDLKFLNVDATQVAGTQIHHAGGKVVAMPGLSRKTQPYRAIS